MATTTPAVPDAELNDDDILLTDAERAGMEDGDEDELDAKPEPETETEAAPEPAAPEGEPEPEDGFAAATIPPLRGGDTAAATARMAEIEAEADRLATEFDDGEMTATEYRTANAKLMSEQSDLQWTIRKADLAQEMVQQTSEAAWFSDVGTFLNEKKSVLKPNTLMLQAFDLSVRQVTSDTANDAMSNRAKLQKAYDRLAAELWVASGKPDAPPNKSNKPTMRDLPPNLRDVPAADLETTDSGTFAVLDRLMETDSQAFENRLGQMSEAQQDAYLRSR